MYASLLSVHYIIFSIDLTAKIEIEIVSAPRSSPINYFYIFITLIIAEIKVFPERFPFH